MLLEASGIVDVDVLQPVGHVDVVAVGFVFEVFGGQHLLIHVDVNVLSLILCVSCLNVVLINVAIEVSCLTIIIDVEAR